MAHGSTERSRAGIDSADCSSHGKHHFIETVAGGVSNVRRADVPIRRCCIYATVRELPRITGGTGTVGPMVRHRTER